MTDLAILASNPAKASLIFDGSTILQLNDVPVLPLLDPIRAPADLISDLQQLRRVATDFAGQPPDRLRLYRPAGLPKPIAEQIEAAAFGAGFDDFLAIGLDQVLPELIAVIPGQKYLAIESQPGWIGGYVLEGTGAAKFDIVSETFESVNEPLLLREFMEAISAQTKVDASLAQALAAEMIPKWWSTPGTNWQLETRRWAPRDGWSSASLGPEDLSVPETRIRDLLKAVTARLDPVGAVNNLVVMGDCWPRIGAFAKADGRTLIHSEAQLPDLFGAMMLSLRKSSQWEPIASTIIGTLPTVRLLFDPRSQIGLPEAAFRRENTAMAIPVELGTELVIAGIPARLHRTGFEIEFELLGERRRVNLFENMAIPERPTLTVIVSSKKSAAGGMLRVTLPQLGQAVLLIFGWNGTEPITLCSFSLAA